MPTDIEVSKVNQEKFVFMQARIDYKEKEQFTKFEKFPAPKDAWIGDLQPGKKCKVAAVKDGKTEVNHVAGFIKFV